MRFGTRAPVCVRFFCFTPRARSSIETVKKKIAKRPTSTLTVTQRRIVLAASLRTVFFSHMTRPKDGKSRTAVNWLQKTRNRCENNIIYILYIELVRGKLLGRRDST